MFPQNSRLSSKQHFVKGRLIEGREDLPMDTWMAMPWHLTKTNEWKSDVSLFLKSSDRSYVSYVIIVMLLLVCLVSIPTLSLLIKLYRSRNFRNSGHSELSQLSQASSLELENVGSKCWIKVFHHQNGGSKSQSWQSKSLPKPPDWLEDAPYTSSVLPGRTSQCLPGRKRNDKKHIRWPLISD